MLPGSPETTERPGALLDYAPVLAGAHLFYAPDWASWGVIWSKGKNNPRGDLLLPPNLCWKQHRPHSLAVPAQVRIGFGRLVTSLLPVPTDFKLQNVCREADISVVEKGGA